MDFYFYYFFHAAVALFSIIVLLYLIKKIISSSTRTKLLSFLLLLVISNFSFFKYGVSILNINIANYRYQNCDGSFRYLNTQFEHKMDTKNQVLDEFNHWKKQYHIVDDTLLYRTFDFKWWMFWEYYTYYTTDIYQLPLLPKQCIVKQ